MSNDVLNRMYNHKKEFILQQKKLVSETRLLEQLQYVSPTRGFGDKLKGNIAIQGNSLITEIRKATPGKGILRQDFNPIDIAFDYKEAGCCCISVVTEEKFYLGSNQLIQDVRNCIDLPLLRKDFIVDPYQIIESRLIGSDAVLIIMALLSPTQAQELTQIAKALQMDVVLEVHNEKDLAKALLCDSDLILINNRNLKTLEMDLNTTESLIKLLDDSYTIICEGGIQTADDVTRINLAGAYCFLVGELLLRQDDIKSATKSLLL